MRGKFDKDNSKSINPLIDLKPNQKINPIYFQDNEPNSSRRFAILRTTDNGAYVVGDMLYYNMNGIEIYTVIDNIIFVDLNNKSVRIRNNQKISEQITPDNPEERQYIFLITNNDDLYEWVSLVGRTEAYNWIKENIELYGFDPDESIVLTETVQFKDALSVTKFVKYLQNASLVDDSTFDIEYYRIGVVDDET